MAEKYNYTKFPDVLLNMLHTFTPVQWQIISLVVRKNLGYSKPCKEYSFRYIARKLNHSPETIRKELNRLLARGIFTRTFGKDKINILEINPEYLTSVPEISTLSVPENGTSIRQLARGRFAKATRHAKKNKYQDDLEKFNLKEN